MCSSFPPRFVLALRASEKQLHRVPAKRTRPVTDRALNGGRLAGLAPAVCAQIENRGLLVETPVSLGRRLKVAFMAAELADVDVLHGEGAFSVRDDEWDRSLRDARRRIGGCEGVP